MPAEAAQQSVSIMREWVSMSGCTPPPSAQTRLSYKARKLASSRRRANAAKFIEFMSIIMHKDTSIVKCILNVYSMPWEAITCGILKNDDTLFARPRPSNASMR